MYEWFIVFTAVLTAFLLLLLAAALLIRLPGRDHSEQQDLLSAAVRVVETESDSTIAAAIDAAAAYLVKRFNNATDNSWQSDIMLGIEKLHRAKDTACDPTSPTD